MVSILADLKFDMRVFPLFLAQSQHNREHKICDKMA